MRLPWYESCPYILLGRHLHDSKIPWGLGEKIMRNICWSGKQLPTPPPTPSFSTLRGCRPGQGFPTPAAARSINPPNTPQQASSKQERKSLLKTSLLPFQKAMPDTPFFFSLIKAKVGGMGRTWTILYPPPVICSDPPENTVKVELFKPWVPFGCSATETP